MIDMKGGKVKVEKTENHELLENASSNLANFDITLLYTSLRPNQSCQKSKKISLDFNGLVESCDILSMGFVTIWHTLNFTG